MKASYEKYSKLRDKRGLTDYRVAKDINESKTTLYNWKHGKCCPKMDKLSILANYFGVTIDSLVS